MSARNLLLALLIAACFLCAAPAAFAQRPDLTVTDIVFVNGGKQGLCNSIRVNIRNSQNYGVSDPFDVNLRTCGFIPESGTESRTVRVGGIGPGATQSVWFHEVMLSMGDSCDEVRATVDSGGRIAEGNERNNTRTESVRTPEQCDFFTITDTSVREPLTGSRNAAFVVRLNEAQPRSTQVKYVTALTPYWQRDGLNAATSGYFCGYRGADYDSTTGKIYFRAGEVSKTVYIPICGDTRIEGKEVFSVNLYEARGGVAIRDRTGKGTIYDSYSFTSRITTRGVDAEEAAEPPELLPEEEDEDLPPDG